MANLKVSQDIDNLLQSTDFAEFRGKVGVGSFMAPGYSHSTNSNALAAGIVESELFLNTTTNDLVSAKPDDYTLLTKQPDPLLAYSLRRLSSNTESSVRIRRFDNLEADVGFDSKDEFSLESPISPSRTEDFILEGATGAMAAYNGHLFHKVLLNDGGYQWNDKTRVDSREELLPIFTKGNGDRWHVYDAPLGVSYNAALWTTPEANPWESDWTGTDLETATFNLSPYGKTLGEFVNQQGLVYSSKFVQGDNTTDGWFTSQVSDTSGNVFRGITPDPDSVSEGYVFRATLDALYGVHYVNRNAMQAGYLDNNERFGDNYDVELQVYVPSSNSIVDGIHLMDGSGGMPSKYENIATDQWVTLTTSGTAHGPSVSVRALYGSDGMMPAGTAEGDVYYIRNVVVNHKEGAARVTTWYDQSGATVKDYNLYPARAISATTQDFFDVNKTDDRNFQIVSGLVNDDDNKAKFISLLDPPEMIMGTQRISFNVTVNSGDISNFMFRLSYRDDQSNLQPVEGFNNFEFDLYDDGVPQDPQIYFAIHTESSYDITISNLKIYSFEITEDQTRHDAWQNTANRQPWIMDKGSLILRNGKPFMKSANSFTAEYANDTGLFINRNAVNLPALSSDGTSTLFAVYENKIEEQLGWFGTFGIWSNTPGSTALGNGGRNRRPQVFTYHGLRSSFTDPNLAGRIIYSADSYGGLADENVVPAAERSLKVRTHVIGKTPINNGGLSSLYINKEEYPWQETGVTLDTNSTFNYLRVAATGYQTTGALYSAEYIYYSSDELENVSLISNDLVDYYLPTETDNDLFIRA